MAGKIRHWRIATGWPSAGLQTSFATSTTLELSAVVDATFQSDHVAAGAEHALHLEVELPVRR
jgi:hypothetical protein